MSQKAKYSNAGKGDSNRVSNFKKYEENWKKIFNKKEEFVRPHQSNKKSSKS
jgi:putative alpha-1,2-mannosidase|tara:strand:+ start:255 stop:410 length:156 start_codon:yes stop_codon:yes gene_type:complete